MEERKVRQIKGALLKCAEENRNKPTPTFNICVSALCTDAEQYIRELEAQIEKMKCFNNCLTFGVFKCPAQSDKTIKSCIGCKDWKLKE